MSEQGYVYFVETAGPIKIGWTVRQVDERLRELGTGNPEKLRVRVALAGERTLEAEMQARFSHARYSLGRGREWFSPADDLLAFLDSHTSGFVESQTKDALVQERKRAYSLGYKAGQAALNRKLHPARIGGTQCEECNQAFHQSVIDDLNAYYARCDAEAAA